MTKLELHRLAGAVATLRPDWPPASLQTFLERHLAHRPLHDAALALIACALDPDTTTPARVLEAGPWWHTSATRDVPTTRNTCPEHPHAGIRTDPRTGEQTCGGCHADRHADTTSRRHDRGGRPPTPDVRRQLIDAIHQTPTTPDAATSQENAHG